MSGRLVGGSNLTPTGTVTISRGTDPGDGGNIACSVSTTATATFPSGASFIIPTGQNTGTFTIRANNLVATSTQYNLTAQCADSFTTPITVEPFVLTLVMTSSITSGSVQNGSGGVSIDAPAGPNGVQVNLTPVFNGITYSTSGPVISSGNTSQTFTFYGSAVVTSSTLKTVTGTITTGLTATAQVTLNPFHIVSFAAPSSLQQGESGQLVVTLDNAPRSTTGALGVSFTQNASGVGLGACCPQANILVNTTQVRYNVSGNGASSALDDTLTASITGASATALVRVIPGINQDTKCASCEGNGGAPINFTNGNTWITHSDYVLPGIGGGINVTRTWNSRWPQMSPVETVGQFGNAWRSTYEERLQTLTGGITKYWLADGTAWTFSYNTLTSTYRLESPFDAHATLTMDPLTSNRVVEFVDGSQKIFNSGGYLITLIDRNGNTTNVAHDGSNRITTVTDAASRVLRFNYTGSSKLVTSIQDSTGVIASYNYGASSELTRVTYADGSQINYSQANPQLLITSVTDKNTKVLESHTYDGSYRGLTSSRANNVDKITVSYTSTTQTRVTDSASNLTDYAFTSAGGHRMITAVNGPGCNSCGGRGVNTFVYDPNGNRTDSTNPLLQNAQFTYDSSGNLLTRTVHLDANTPLTMTYTYNSFGEVLTATDPAGNVTTNTYDTHGNLLTTTTPSPSTGVSGSTTTFEYFTNGLLKKVTDPLSHATNLTYTSAGLLETITDAQSHVTTFAYDARGNRTSVTDADNNVTSFEYDLMNRLTKVTNPDLTYTQFAYDTRGCRTSVTDANNKVTSYAYDDADRLTSVTDAASNVTAYAYDNENNLTGITDAANHTTNFQYDTQGRVTRTTFPSTLYETYSYDNGGNLLSKVDRKSNVTTYYYDGLNRLYKKHYQDGSEVDYTYDHLSRLTQASDATGTYGLSYDNMGRLTGTTTQYSFLSGTTFTMGYGYDAASNRTSFTDPQSGVTNYVYDTLNRLSSLTNPQSQQFTFGYDVLSRRTSLTRPNNVTTSYSYDSLSRLLSVLHKDSTLAVIDGATYTVDNVGNRMSKTNERTTVPESYTYDPIYQLTQVQQTVSGTPTTTETYAYDSIGNRTSSLNIASYTVNSSNQLTSTTSSSYTYDNNGNTLTDSGKNAAYTWDLENRLSQVSFTGGGTVNYKYDPFGRRIYRSGPSGTTIWLYDGANIVEEFDGAGALQATYTQGSGVDEPLAMLRGTTTDYYEADGLGSVTSLTDSSGAIAETYTYDAYGNLTAGGTSLTNPFRYTGREWDQDVGLYYYRARYYAAETGKFLNEDPIRASLNLFQYSHNAPLVNRDPFGLYDGWDLLKDFGSMSEGAVDFALFGSASRINNAFGADVAVNRCGLAHRAGAVIGFTLSAAITGGLAAEATTVAESGALVEGAFEGAEQTGITVYRSLDEFGNVQYVGITNDLERRAAEHAVNGIFNLEEVVSGLTRLEARGVEQVLIEEYGLSRKGGQLINQINSISKFNPLYRPLTTFGKQVLQNIGYF